MIAKPFPRTASGSGTIAPAARAASPVAVLASRRRRRAPRRRTDVCAPRSRRSISRGCRPGASRLCDGLGVAHRERGIVAGSDARFQEAEARVRARRRAARAETDSGCSRAASRPVRRRHCRKAGHPAQERLSRATITWSRATTRFSLAPPRPNHEGDPGRPAADSESSFGDVARDLVDKGGGLRGLPPLPTGPAAPPAAAAPAAPPSPVPMPTLASTPAAALTNTTISPRHQLEAWLAVMVKAGRERPDPARQRTPALASTARSASSPAACPPPGPLLEVLEGIMGKERMSTGASPARPTLRCTSTDSAASA